MSVSENVCIVLPKPHSGYTLNSATINTGWLLIRVHNDHILLRNCKWNTKAAGGFSVWSLWKHNTTCDAEQGHVGRASRPGWPVDPRRSAGPAPHRPPRGAITRNARPALRGPATDCRPVTRRFAAHAHSQTPSDITGTRIIFARRGKYPHIDRARLNLMQSLHCPSLRMQF